MGILSQVAKRIKAYHGSPHDFDKFSSENIGTGEGAQAYGHGLYFAEREGTAQSYRDALTPRDFDYEEHLMEQYKAAESMQDYNRMDMLERAMQHDTPADFRDIASDVDYDDDYRQLANDMADEMEGFVNPRGNPVNFGRMYEVDISASADELLDYDVPLKDQPEKIQNAFKDIWRDGLADDPILKEIYKTADDVDFNTMGLFDQSQGSQAYKEFSNKLGGEAALSKLLNDKGIKGIKYADAQTRFSPKGRTNNYVIFDDKTVEIARKYGVSMPVAGAILAGTMTPEQAQAFVPQAKDGLLKDTGDVLLETMAGVNRGVMDALNFVTTDQVNAVSQLMGSDKRVPTLYDVPLIEEATSGNFMDKGALRQAVRQGSEFLSPI